MVTVSNIMSACLFISFICLIGGLAYFAYSYYNKQLVQRTAVFCFASLTGMVVFTALMVYFMTPEETALMEKRAQERETSLSSPLF